MAAGVRKGAMNKRNFPEVNLEELDRLGKTVEEALAEGEGEVTGSCNLTISKDLHSKIVSAASMEGCSIEEYLRRLVGTTSQSD